jgi:small GTP-binding protein
MASLEAKIVVLGSQGVGKTSLVHRYVHSSFRPHGDPPSTIGASFLTKRVLDSDTDTVVRLQIWDTAGQERFRSISRLYYRGANACILCYSITDEESFNEMGKWLRDLRKELGESVILHVVGTKADLVAQDPGTREVPFERCIAYVAENLYPALSSTPPATATPGVGSSEGVGGYRQWLASNGLAGMDGARSPSSKRSSGFWGQDVGWDCCHEISAESGEGVEEVFRVVTRKLVEQNRKAMEMGFSPGGTPSAAPGMDGAAGYFDGMAARGSFRVGRDRRSWLGFPSAVLIDEAAEQETAPDERKVRRKCC